jgi:hypothetical protein
MIDIIAGLVRLDHAVRHSAGGQPIDHEAANC